MNRLISTKTIKILKIILIIYITIGALIYLFQDLLILHPKSLPADYKFSFDHPFKEINITVEDNRNINIIQFLTTKEPKGVVLYFHGNMSNIERYADAAKIFTNNDYEVWMIDYPGFGKSTGKFKEESVYSDALLMYESAKKQFNSKEIIIYGRSLGTGIASFLASNKEEKHLILETPYYTLKALAKDYFFLYPAAALIKYKFPNNEYLKKVNSPITILHGTKDEVVPYQHSKKLKNENPAVNLITIKNGKHNNLSQYPIYNSQINSIIND